MRLGRVAVFAPIVVLATSLTLFHKQGTMTSVTSHDWYYTVITHLYIFLYTFVCVQFTSGANSASIHLC